MEVTKGEIDNPIMQDTKDNAPRFYSYGVPFFNYGLLPQTWEDPNYIDQETRKCPADVITHMLISNACVFYFYRGWRRRRSN
jgi:inorganic pyrophosphatase